MNKARNLTKSQWTIFWKDLSIDIPKNDRRRKKYKKSNINQRFKRADILTDSLAGFYSVFDSFPEPELQILRFCDFFIPNIELIKNHLNSSSYDEAFLEMVKLFKNSSVDKIKNILYNIHLLSEYERKGEGRQYTTELKVSKSKATINGKHIQPKLSKSLNPTRYEFKGLIKNKNQTIYCFSKKRNRKTNPIFLKTILGDDKKMAVYISADSNREIKVILSHLSKTYDSFIHSPELKLNFDKLLNFLKEGKSTNFLLYSVSYVAGNKEYTISKRLSRYDPFGIEVNSQLKKIKSLDEITRFTLKHKSDDFKLKNIKIYVSSIENSKIIGAVNLSFLDRNFKTKEREVIKSDFEKDFCLPLGVFIKTDELGDEILSRLFLQNKVKKSPAVSMKTKKYWDFIRLLIKLELIPKNFDEDIKIKYCFNPTNCTLAYRPQDTTRVHCAECKATLFSKKELSIGKINDDKFAELIRSIAEENGYQAKTFSKTLLGKKIYLVEVIKKKQRITYLPISSHLSDEQKDLLSFRLSDVCIITSQGDNKEYQEKGIISLHMHEFFKKVYLEKNHDSIFKNSNKLVRMNSIDAIKSRANESYERIKNENFYLNKRKEIGADFFEADCYSLLRCMFGLSNWLGSTQRGKPVPDGKSIFPIYPSLAISSACFIWDSKLTKDEKSTIGSHIKNRAYIKNLYTDKSTKSKRYKGFVFISNKPCQSNFRKAARKISLKKKVKISYLHKEQLISIYELFKEHEGKIEQSEKIKKDFFSMFMDIFTRTGKKHGGRVLVISENLLTKQFESFKTKNNL